LGERLALAAVAVLALSPLFTWASVQGGFARSVLQAETARILFALGLAIVVPPTLIALRVAGRLDRHELIARGGILAAAIHAGLPLLHGVLYNGGQPPGPGQLLALCATVALATGAVLDLDRLVSLRELSRRAGPGQRLAMIGSAVLLASLFLPWIGPVSGWERLGFTSYSSPLSLVTLLVLPAVLTPVGIVAMGAARRPLSVTAASWGTLGAGAACALGVFLAVAGSYLAAGQVALGFVAPVVETGVGPGVWAAIAASVIVIVGGVIAGRPDVSRRTNTAADDAAMAVGPDTPPEQGRSVYPGIKSGTDVRDGPGR
jgi:hypothetical protein